MKETVKGAWWIASWTRKWQLLLCTRWGAYGAWPEGAKGEPTAVVRGDEELAGPPGALALPEPERGCPEPSGGQEKEGKRCGQRGKGWEGPSGSRGGGPEKRRCSMKSL